MKISYDFPPNIDELNKHFTLGPRMVATYGDTLHNPGMGPIDRSVLAHEETHMRQQESVGGPKLWWKRFIADKPFRAHQEVEAYRNQYREAKKYLKSRDQLARLLYEISGDLSGEQYGNLMTRNEAMRAILS